jgi:FAD:protein FMN transferase
VSGPEVIERFECFGSACAVHVRGDAPGASAREAAAKTRRTLLDWHERFSRFSAASELSLLNRDARERVPASATMARIAASVSFAATVSDGLVDATLLDQIEAAGYTGELGEPLALDDALARAPARRPGAPHPGRLWRALDVDLERNIIARPAGLKIDGGGLAKGLFADLLAAELDGHASFAIDCGGDIGLGGSAGLARTVEVESPFDSRIIHTFASARSAVATSGIGRRAWTASGGGPAHHLLDPRTGAPAFTGIVQATALAASALLADTYAKAAVLSGPDRAARWLGRHGGVIVLEDGSHRVIAPRPAPAGVTAAAAPARLSGLSSLAKHALSKREAAAQGRCA